MAKRNTTKRAGFMAIEILVAASIIAASVLAATMVSQKSVYVSRRSLHTVQAAHLLEEGAEAVRIVRDNSWSNISSLVSNTDYYPNFSGGTWTLSSVPSTVDSFSRTVRISPVLRDNTTKDISETGANDAETKLVTVTVAWIEGGTPITKTLQFYLMNIF